MDREFYMLYLTVIFDLLSFGLVIRPIARSITRNERLVVKA